VIGDALQLYTSVLHGSAIIPLSVIIPYNHDITVPTYYNSSLKIMYEQVLGLSTGMFHSCYQPVIIVMIVDLLLS